MRHRLVSAAGLAYFAVAFDKDAHDAIGQTCASAMDQVAIKQVKRLLGGQDASDVAAWGHEVAVNYPSVDRLHFQVHDDSLKPFCGPVSEQVSKCEDNMCLLQAIKHFYGKVLQDEGRKIDYPSLDYGKLGKGIKFTDADSVKMLINLIGDLHQPMHVGFAGDDNGKKVQVKFRGMLMSLYDVWDKAISEAVRTQESSFWLGGWTHVRAVSSEYARDKELWEKEGAFKSFERWIQESVEFACTKAYTHPIAGFRIAGPNAEPGPIIFNEDGYHAWRELWLKQILIAGERTAIVLNDILDAKGASRLHDGSGVKTSADQEREKEQVEWDKARAERRKTEKSSSSIRPRFNPDVLLKNLIIAAITVPLTLLVANHGLNPQNVANAVRSLLESPSSSTETSSSSSGSRAKRFD